MVRWVLLCLLCHLFHFSLSCGLNPDLSCTTKAMETFHFKWYLIVDLFKLTGSRVTEVGDCFSYLEYLTKHIYIYIITCLS